VEYSSSYDQTSFLATTTTLIAVCVLYLVTIVTQTCAFNPLMPTVTYGQRLSVRVRCC